MSDKYADMPNFMMINVDDNESPYEIIQDYFEMIQHCKHDDKAIYELLELFYDDVVYWSNRQLLINQAKSAMGQLEELDAIEKEYIDEMENDED